MPPTRTPPARKRGGGGRARSPSSSSSPNKSNNTRKRKSQSPKPKKYDDEMTAFIGLGSHWIKRWFGKRNSMTAHDVDPAAVFNLATKWASGLALFCLVAEIMQPTMYGKFADVSRMTVSPRLGWWIMELPCSLVFLYLFWIRDTTPKKNRAQLVLGTMFSLHYVYRGWIYPWFVLNVHRESKGFDVMSAFGAWLVTGTHAYLNAAWIGKFAKFKPSYLRSNRFMIGVVLYYMGLILIIQQDVLMQAARSGANAPRYSIPTGGLWDHSTSAQYLAELIAWFGWMVTNDFGPNGQFIFFVSLFNLVPRAHTNYTWYATKFGTQFLSLGRAKLIPGIW